MKHAFSLVELSIVLVILGLLTGGILTGQSLIRAAELRSVTTEFQNYQTAVMTFRQKYFALPGDMTNATAFWDEAHATPATCLTTAGTGTQTCNGNGDGIINQNNNEVFRFWEQLANAGLIEGTFTGITNGSTAFSHVFGDNSPASKLSNGGWSASAFEGSSPFSGNTFIWDGNDIARNNFWFGAQRANAYNADEVLTPEEAWNIDKKTDDGQPAYGKIITYNTNGWNNSGGTLERCTLGTSGADKSKGYALSVTSIQCAIYFTKAF